MRPGAAMTAAGTTPTLATRWRLEWNKFFVLQDQNLSEKGRRRKTNDEVVGVMGQGVGWLSGGGELTGDRGGVWWCFSILGNY